METVGERLRYIIENQYGNVKEFCEKFKIHYPGLTSILNNKRPLGMEVFVQIKNAIPSIDSEWVLFGNDRGITNIDNSLLQEKISEPMQIYGADPVEKMFLKYLNQPEIIKLILKNVKIFLDEENKKAG